MQIPEFLENLCRRISEAYGRAFGEPTASGCGNAPLPVDAVHAWLQACSVSKCSKVILTNTGANAVEWTLNANDTVGIPLEAGASFTLDDIRGIIYARCQDKTLASTLNFGIIALW